MQTIQDRLQQYQYTLEELRLNGVPFREGVVLCEIALLYSQSGRPHDALKAYHQALKIFVSLESNEGCMLACSGLSLVYSQLNTVDAAAHYATWAEKCGEAVSAEVAELHHRLEQLQCELEALVANGRQAALDPLDLDIAQARLALSSSRAEDVMESLEQTAHIFYLLGQTLASMGALKRADAVFEATLKILRKTNARTARANAIYQLARVQHMLRNPQAALMHYRDAKRHFEAIGWRRAAAECDRRISEVLLLIEAVEGPAARAEAGHYSAAR